jgi:2-dehydro-3-deoxygluconokinase
MMPFERFSMTKILCVGEVMLEMSDMGGGLYKKSYAGDTFNVAHYLNVVTRGRIKADYLTAVGTDAESEACLEFMREKGVLTSKCQRNPNRTIGLFVLSNDEKGEKQYGYWRGQSAARLLFDRPQDVSGYDLIYLSGITAAITENKSNLIQSITAAKQHGAQIAYDFNHRVRLWEPGAARAFAEQILPQVDIVKISDEELAFLYPDKSVAEFSTAYPQAEWVLTCGSEKGEVWKKGNMLARKKFTAVTEVVDSSAAGDSFIASYLAGKLAGASPLDGLKRGHAIASQVVLGKGSIVAIDLTKLD